MKQVALLQIGFGTVGGALIEQVLANQERWRRALHLDVRIAGVAGRQGAVVEDTADGLESHALRRLIARRRGDTADDAGMDAPLVPIDEAVRRVVANGPAVVIDAAAGDETSAVDALAIEQGAGVVLSNKAPLALPASDPRGAILWAETAATGRLRYEATCGAGLPVISTLRALLDTGDEVIEITGALSGTFGAIFSSVAAGLPFSRSVRDAKDQGYTEPDPRDDLSGLDVARKALILARTIGQHMDLSDITVHSLVAPSLTDVSVPEFLDRLDEMDPEIAQRAQTASGTGAVLKYIAQVKGDGAIDVGLREVPTSTVLGALQGPENIVSFQTRRYDQYPCVVSGPGAGADVTAAGMIADVLSLARQFA